MLQSLVVRQVLAAGLKLVLQSLAAQGAELALVLQSRVVRQVPAAGPKLVLHILAAQAAELTLVLQSLVVKSGERSEITRTVEGTFVTRQGRKRSGLRPGMLESVEQRTRTSRMRQQIARHLSIK